ncbi:facilitated trehalose transporter Tret1-like [Contarinia nasturtii]|uniref:facilitated trehalose transporter Tret1-like n=1 Tax=Contarinia nasturtii TaxID=265458 RepID=UPI0012D3B6C3|nr:facilitated trehalose transporter Tret1-like [Contarinia nasturtii]
MTPYLQQIFKAYQSPIAPKVATSIVSVMNVFATITFLCLVRFVGKRRMYLTVLSGVCISSFVISVYGIILLPSDYNSFNKENNVPELNGSWLVYIPTFFLIIWNYCSYCGILMMPWMFLSELFPFKSRGAAAGLSAAINYIMGFVTIKTYINLEKALSMQGIAMFYCVIATLGLILMYNIMPETENRSLEAIELHFSDSSKKITDWYIPHEDEVRKSNK